MTILVVIARCQIHFTGDIQRIGLCCKGSIAVVFLSQECTSEIEIIQITVIIIIKHQRFVSGGRCCGRDVIGLRAENKVPLVESHPHLVVGIGDQIYQVVVVDVERFVQIPEVHTSGHSGSIHAVT